MEIEKKYLVGEIPSNLEGYDKWEIEQCYLCSRPTLRIRKKNEDYILTYKNRQSKSEDQLCVSIEEEFPLTREAYEHLKAKADGKIITKTRYRIPYEGHIIELDLFHGYYDGFVLAEVEFESVEESKEFIPPDWFLDDVSGDYRYTNSYLANQ